MELLICIVFVACGVLFLCGAIKEWDWFMKNYKTRFAIFIFGRTGARIFYVLVGIFIIICGVIIFMGSLDLFS